MQKVKFSLEKLLEPDAIYYPGYFWMWNGPLSKDVIIKQIQDMKEHEARSICALPMPKGFRPDSTNNQLDVSYLEDDFFEFVKVAVNEAERLGMNYWLYDEGGWPSGEACGLVTKDHPELKASVMRYKDQESEKWQLQKTGSVDRLNPEATQRFIDLTHDGYKNAVGDNFGKAIVFAFTDEPSAGRIAPGQQLPWTDGLSEEFKMRFGYGIEDHFDVFENPSEKLTKEQKKVRVDFFDLWSQRFVDAYFLPIQQWCRENGILSSGHLGGDDETLGSVIQGFGHILRTLRAMDVPGVDVIWRQVFPHKVNHHFPLYASTAAHQIGSPYAFTESFCVYGNGLTIEQMKWITDYQYVRGINLFVGGCYPLSTRDHLMCGERPHFGPINPLWDYIQNFHRYVARIGYVLSCGKPRVENAVYFPIRDMWANGIRNETIVEFENLVESLLENQCAFDLVDDDVIAKACIKDGACRVGEMVYRRILCPPCSWMNEKSLIRLAEFVRSGGSLICLKSLPEAYSKSLSELIDSDTMSKIQIFDSAKESAKELTPLVGLKSSGIRVISREWKDGSAYFIFNEGDKDFNGLISFQESQNVYEFDPNIGKLWSLIEKSRNDNNVAIELSIPSSQSRMLIFGDYPSKERPEWNDVATMTLTNGWQARILRQFDVGEHDYEIRTAQDDWKPIELGAWKNVFSEDFSGDVSYRIKVPILEEWRNCSMILQLGQVEYVAKVYVNGNKIGNVVWGPWEIELPKQNEPFSFRRVTEEQNELEIVVTNTLANVLTSERVRNDWKNRKGPGWPGPYDARAAEFEKDSRGGGLFGPVTLKIGYWQEK